MPAFEVDNPVVSCDMASSSQHKCCDKDQSCLLNSSLARGNVKFTDCCVQSTEKIVIKPQNLIRSVFGPASTNHQFHHRANG